MTRILKSTIAAAALAIPAALSAADYTVFRVCEDQHVLRTSDGAEAGRVEYIVFEPTSHRVVSAIVTGGIVAEKHIAVPMTAFQFGAERQVTLTNITRERLVAAPAFEVTQLRSRAVIEPALVERTYTHFGLNAADITRSSTTTERNATSTSTTINDPASNRPNAPTRTSTETAIDPANRDATNPNTTTPPKPGDASKDDASPGSARKNREASDRLPNTRPGRGENTPNASDSAPDRSNTPPRGQDEKAPGASPNKNQKDNPDAARSDAPSKRSNPDAAPGGAKPDAERANDSGNAKSGSERPDQPPKETKAPKSDSEPKNDSKPNSDAKENSNSKKERE